MPFRITSVISCACKVGFEANTPTITSQVIQLAKLHIDERYYKDIIESLFYPHIFPRQEQVANEFDGIENSYEWIFDEPLDAKDISHSQFIELHRKPRWDNFRNGFELKIQFTGSTGKLALESPRL